MTTIVLLSGGLDSAVVLAQLVQKGEPCEALGFYYGQRHAIELERAAKIAEHYGVPFEVQGAPLVARIDDVVFAARNLLFAALGVAYAQTKGADMVAVGCNRSDWERFPDCRPHFWNNVDAVTVMAYGVRIAAPLVTWTKREVVSHARKLDVPIGLTWSCYIPIDGEPCGACLACKTREEALR